MLSSLVLKLLLLILLLVRIPYESKLPLPDPFYSDLFIHSLNYIGGNVKTRLRSTFNSNDTIHSKQNFGGVGEEEDAMLITIFHVSAVSIDFAIVYPHVN